MHSIEHLMQIATKQFKKMSKNEIHTIDQAAAQYRKLRGRHPPPGFDAWYAYAVSHKAIINERFWDQIHHDLAPFWSIEPVVLRKQVHVFSPKISIRNGKVEAKSNNQHSKLGNWEDMLLALSNESSVQLPDIDIPLNVNDESAMLVPWETIDTALSMSRKIMLEPGDVVSEFSRLGDMEALIEDYEWKPEWLGPRLTHPASHLGPRPLWSLIRPACSPKSNARREHVYNDIWDPQRGVKDEHSAAALLPRELPKGALKGYVKNWTNVVDPCQQPDLQGLHSAFVSPKEMGVAVKLFPLFGDAKFTTSNEILLPGAREWNMSSLEQKAPISWDERRSKLYWRGSSTIARQPERYWRRFQLERLMGMLNATHIEIAEASIHTGNESTVGVGYAKNFRLLPANEYELKSQTGGSLAEWVNGWADAGFTELNCALSVEEEQEDVEKKVREEGCEGYFSTAVAHNEESEAAAKFALVVDDESLVTHLHAAKVTLRTSVYRQWYDARLIPWLHYVPLDNTFVDLYGVMEYFIGSRDDHDSTQAGNEPQIPPTSQHSKRSSHDDVARQIAEASKVWADKVLRREDILIYVYRLLLEYARVVDDRRDRIGWVRDLKQAR
ncbi:hypothetical protein DE146DRAFT_619935 [Phaeosphaeria sp. MPI-PUGE-AT-0046c]|nr:hypothetical protein DE146DRAFT_619935 [Phaeosphaeria sp. MPI-PUGE-AT-0046c]